MTSFLRLPCRLLAGQTWDSWTPGLDVHFERMTWCVPRPDVGLLERATLHSWRVAQLASRLLRPGCASQQSFIAVHDRFSSFWSVTCLRLLDDLALPAPHPDHARRWTPCSVFRSSAFVPGVSHNLLLWQLLRTCVSCCRRCFVNASRTYLGSKAQRPIPCPIRAVNGLLFLAMWAGSFGAGGHASFCGFCL